MATKREQIASLISARQAIMRASGRVPRRARMPRFAEPNAVRVAYYAELRSMMRSLRELVRTRLVPQLPGIIALMGTTLDSLHEDSREAERRLKTLVDGILNTFFKEHSDSKIAAIADTFAGRTAAFSERQLSDALKSRAGIGMEQIKGYMSTRVAPKLEPALRKHIAENVRLIKDVPTTYMRDVQQRVLLGAAKGRLHGDIASEILDERYGVAERRSRLIARDQVGKYYGVVQKLQQAELGVTHFTWRTVNDNRVREEHDEREGKRYAWAEPPDDGIPGHPINCRCWAEPDLDALISELS